MNIELRTTIEHERDVIERTLFLIKPDAIEDNLSDKIFKRIKDSGYKVVAMYEKVPNRDFVGEHYPYDEEYLFGMGEKEIESMDLQEEDIAALREENRIALQEANLPEKSLELVIGEEIREKNIKFLESKPVIAMILEKENAIKDLRVLVGRSDPSVADEGTIRGDLCDDSFAEAAKRGENGETVRNGVHASDSKKNADKEIKKWFGEKYLIQ